MCTHKFWSSEDTHTLSTTFYAAAKQTKVMCISLKSDLEQRSGSNSLDELSRRLSVSESQEEPFNEMLSVTGTGYIWTEPRAGKRSRSQGSWLVLYASLHSFYNVFGPLCMYF